MCAGASKEERTRWKLGELPSYAFLTQSPCTRLAGVDDAEEYQVGAQLGA